MITGPFKIHDLFPWRIVDATGTQILTALMEDTGDDLYAAELCDLLNAGWEANHPQLTPQQEALKHLRDTRVQIGTPDKDGYSTEG